MADGSPRGVELEDLREAAGRWLKERRPYDRLPAWLYEQALALSSQYSTLELSKILGIRVSTLRRAVAPDEAVVASTPLAGAGVELVKVGSRARCSASTISPMVQSFILEAPGGMKLRLEGLSLAEALLAFKEARA